MKYFIIQHSIDSKILGNYPQVKSVIHNCHVWNNPNFIDRFPFEKIEGITPIVSNPILYNNSIKTDLITVSGVGFSFGSLLISSKLKNIIESHNYLGIQFFKNKLIHENISDINYWQTHVFDTANHLIDFKKTQVNIRDRDKDKKIISIKKSVNDLNTFLELKELNKYPKEVRLENISFIPNENDYFRIDCLEGGSYGIVSEKLKLEIEKLKCTGIEFRPLGVSLNDWFGNDEREKTYGKL